MIKLIVVDLDYTLLNNQYQMSERNETALKAAIEQGVHIVIATGKTRHAARDVLQRLNLTTPGIFLQGLAIYDGAGEIRQQQTLDPAVARQVITFAEDRGFDPAIYSGGRILVRRQNPGAEALATKYHEPEAEVMGPLQNILTSTTINKIIIVKPGGQRQLMALRWQLSMQLDRSARLVQGAIDTLEVLPPGGGKGAALKSVMKDMHINAEEVLAIGDGENDIEMIQLAGIGIAVGNAVESLKQAADYVVASNDEDGVAEAVERFVLKRDEPQTTEATADAETMPDTGEVAVIATGEAAAPVENAQITDTDGE